MTSTRERRSDAVAKSMGELLLKGYRMLATSCDTCDNVLLQDREGLIICINCSENEPVRDENDKIVSQNTSNQIQAAQPEKLTVTTAHTHSSLQTSAPDAAEILLMMEITSATRYLENLPPGGTDLQHKQIYIRHIRECAETIKALRSIK